MKNMRYTQSFTCARDLLVDSWSCYNINGPNGSGPQPLCKATCDEFLKSIENTLSSSCPNLSQSIRSNIMNRFANLCTDVQSRSGDACVVATERETTSCGFSDPAKGQAHCSANGNDPCCKSLSVPSGSDGASGNSGGSSGNSNGNSGNNNGNSGTNGGNSGNSESNSRPSQGSNPASSSSSSSSSADSPTTLTQSTTGLSTPLIITLSVGSFVLVLGIVAGGFWLYYLQQRKKREGDEVLKAQIAVDRALEMARKGEKEGLMMGLAKKGQKGIREDDGLMTVPLTSPVPRYEEEEYHPYEDEAHLSAVVPVPPKSPSRPRNDEEAAAALRKKVEDRFSLYSVLADGHGGFADEGEGEAGDEGNLLVKYVATAEFEPNLPDELRLNEGDVVQLFSIFKDGWAQGRNETTGQEGTMPISLLRRM
ncbi:hypothetical protein HK102_013430 [Quaeritorhiza haematococci]|nr:hypothetical protein HK102_013430 [Quaeritorhiza haematococci]